MKATQRNKPAGLTESLILKNIDMKTQKFKQKNVSQIKTHSTIIYALLVVFLLMACEKPKEPQITDIKFTECNQKTTSEDENIIVELIDNYLYISHANAAVNCGFTNMDISFTIENDTIVITEKENTDEINDCICFIDISYTIGSIENGKYTLVIKLRDKIIYNQIKTF